MQKNKRFHALIGSVLLITGSLVLYSFIQSYSFGQGENANLPANVNISDDPPYISGYTAWQKPQNVATPLLFNANLGDGPLGYGDTLTGIINGRTYVFVNVNVVDGNGYTGQTINLDARLRRTNNYPVNSGLMIGGFQGDLDASIINRDMIGCWDREGIPGCDNGVACQDVATISPIEHTFSCNIAMVYMSDTTTETYDLPGSVNYVPQHWQMIFRLQDETTTYEDHDIVHYEWPGILGVATLDPYVFLGTTDNKGTVTALRSEEVLNKGNLRNDYRVRTDQLSDAAAWSCQGGGNPLVSDVHQNFFPSSQDYNLMNALTFSDQNTFFDKNHNKGTIWQFWSNEYVLAQYKFATFEPIGTGQCTLSNIVYTALKG